MMQSIAQQREPNSGRESCHRFGSENNLIGIAHVAGNQAASNGCCLLMLTAGMLTSAGPFRLHVQLARAAAAQGVSSFRFDLSGIGESLAVGSAIDSTSRAVAETQQAMDRLQQQYGWDRFVLFGLCSGADDAWNVALADQRVQAAILLDGCGYRAGWYTAHKLLGRQLPNLFRPKKMARKLRQWLGLPAGNDGLPPADDDIREFPDRATAQQQIQTLVDRGVSLQMIYTGGVHDYFNHRGQFRKMFPRLDDRGLIELHYRPRWDHVLYLDQDRQQLIQLVSRWIGSLHCRH